MWMGVFACREAAFLRRASPCQSIFSRGLLGDRRSVLSVCEVLLDGPLTQRKVPSSLILDIGDICPVCLCGSSPTLFLTTLSTVGG